MDYITILGFLAGTLSTISFIPQVAKIWKSKSTKDISLGMYAIFALGSILWLAYGISLNALPIIVVNSVIFTLVLVIIFFKLKYK